MIGRHTCPCCGHICRYRDTKSSARAASWDAVQQARKEKQAEVTHEFMDRFSELFEEGYTLPEIASEFGIKLQSLRRRLRYNGMIEAVDFLVAERKSES